MQYFYRSLRYLKPYKGRLTVSVLCVIAIAVLWGGGLGMVLPGAKILLAEEGLHGWAYNSLTENHLESTISLETPRRPVDGHNLGKVLTLVSATKDGPLAKVKSGTWIVGMDGKVLPGDIMVRQLAQLQPGQEVTLLLDTPPALNGPEVATQEAAAKLDTLTVTLSKESIGSQALRYFAVGTPGVRGPLITEPENYAGRFRIFIYFLIIALVVNVVREIFTFMQEYLVGTSIWLATMDLRCENYNKVLHLPTTFFSEKGVSDATSRFIQDTNELARGQNTLLGKTLVEPAKAVGTLGMALFMSWELTLLTMIAGPPAFLIIRRLGKKMHKASKRALEGWSSMLAVLGETLQGIRVVKAYTMEGAERRRFFRVNRQLVKQQNKKELIDALTGPTVELAGITTGMVAAGIAGYMVFVGIKWRGDIIRMDQFEFLAWMMVLAALFDPVRKLAKVWMRFHESDAAAKRIFDLQDIPEEPHVPNAITLPRLSRGIDFNGVSFRYPSASTDAVKDVTLSIRAGSTVAIVGPNGSGKTTLVSLVPRLMDPTAGQILIDGHNIQNVSVRSLRRQIGLVTQDTVLFHATIGENISYGLRRPKQEDVLAASRRAFVDEFVRDLPAGYDTMVGEHGATLSGGQKQRISIARAILRDPSILIFDEAMSQVDSDSERRIHEAMQAFIKGRTTMMIAHRFATVLAADAIVVMADGRVIDTGTHDELLKRCELYHHLYRTQFLDSGGKAE